MTIEELRRALSGRPFTLLDVVALTPAYRHSTAKLSKAAVLVPVFVRDGEPHVLMTRRRDDLRLHPGQISFPGGRIDPADADAQTAALREAEEEIGLAPVDVRPLGALDDVETVSTRFLITPFVGLVPHPYPWRPCPVEVDGMFTVPLRRLTTPEALRRETRALDGRAVTIETYPLGEHVVWGATLRITRNLLALLGTSA